MTVPTSTDWIETKQEIIRHAFQHIGRYGLGRTISSEDYTFASSVLNNMLKSLQAKGLHLWSKQEGIVFLTPYTGEYSLGTYSYFANKENTLTFSLTTALAAADTTVTISDTSGLTTTKTIGIVLDSGVMHWSTVASITNATQFVLTNAMPSAASSSNLVYYFTTTAGKPMRISSARLIRGIDTGNSGSTQTEIPMSKLSYSDYWDIAAVTTSGSTPNQYMYNPKLNNGTLYVWPRPNTPSVRIQITYERMLADADDVDDNLDVPTEWMEAIEWQLALRLCPAYGKADRLVAIGGIASQMLNNILDWDQENTYIKFSPEIDYGN